MHSVGAEVGEAPGKRGNIVTLSLYSLCLGSEHFTSCVEEHALYQMRNLQKGGEKDIMYKGFGRH